MDFTFLYTFKLQYRIVYQHCSNSISSNPLMYLDVPINTNKQYDPQTMVGKELIEILEYVSK
jgi:hypothetical protein